MQTLVLTLHIIVCVLLIILVLLQAGKEGMGVIFGGGNASVFGSSGAGGMLAKLTAFMAVLFVVTSLSYTFVTSERKSSDDSTILQLDVQLEETAPPQTAPPATTTPAAPAQAAQPAPAVAPAAPAAPAPKAAEPAQTPQTPKNTPQNTPQKTPGAAQ